MTKTMMNTKVSPHRILLISNDPATGNSICAALIEAGNQQFEVEWVHQLAEGSERLRKEKNIAAVLLELDLLDSQGLKTFEQLFVVAPNIPMLIISSQADETLAKQAVERGAQDYILPDHFNAYSLTRALCHAIEHKVDEEALYQEKERAVVTLNSIGDAVLCTDISGKISYLNVVAESLTGWPRDEAIGRRLADVFKIIDGETRQTARDPMEMAVDENKTVGLTLNCVLIRRDGFESAIEDSAAPIHDRSGRITGAVIVFHDVTTARHMANQMTYALHHDLITNLPNRILLKDRIEQAISLAHRQRKSIAVFFLDLDRFKYINDSLGHSVGDKVLQSVSKRLVASVRGSDTVSRQGGDEFVILLSEIFCPEAAAVSAQKILSLVNQPQSIEGHDLHVNASIGISIYPEDGEDAETLIKNADMAMYNAKEDGRNNFKFFKPEMNHKAVERQTVETSLRRALERKEFLLYYQPKVNLATGEITGVEALIRWHHPSRGLMLPAQFVPVAEDCGLIVEIGRWVLREACRQARAWQIAGLPFKRISVNVSPLEFHDRGFLKGVQSILKETRLEGKYLEFELTETVLMENAEFSTSVLQALKAMHVQLAVDDFGTGYSSFSYLRQFPIDVLKIDQSFVKQITSNSTDSTIVGAIIGMGKGLGHLVLAEGVETREQRDYLIGQACAEGQGYLFSHPLAAAEFASLLRLGTGEFAVH
jgi:diguanylate cyclase (GGDEF)-like protein/PAS domain S-box-containing protein